MESGSSPQAANGSAVRYTLLLLAALAACGGPQDDGDNNHGYGSQYDLISPDGVRLRNDPAAPLSQAGFEIQVVGPYRDVEGCTQIMAGGPLIIAIDIPLQMTPPTIGFTFLGTRPLILISPPISDYPFTLRHEFVHYLLAAAGFPDELNRTHQSPLFMKCSGVID